MDLQRYLRRRIREAGNQKALAEQVGISQQFISDMVRGVREPGEEACAKLGIERKTVYREIGDAQQ